MLSLTGQPTTVDLSFYTRCLDRDCSETVVAMVMNGHDMDTATYIKRKINCIIILVIKI